MNPVSAAEAAAALADIDHAGHRVRELRGYRQASPYLMLWGVVWLVANLVTGLRPDLAGQAWAIGTPAGLAGTLLLVVLQVRRARASGAFTPAEQARRRRAGLMVGCALAGFFPAMLAVLAPLEARQSHAFLSLFWAFAYMAGGAWLGTRLFVTGVVTAAAILVGYFWITDAYYLWMAVAGGGSLLLGGWWLRRI